MAKAILVTLENKDRLAADYDLDDDEVLEAVGTYLVADFGHKNEIFDFVSPLKLIENYKKTGVDLENGFFEIVRK